MSGGGGGSGNDGSNDMEVSGYEAAMSNEKGISTHSDSRSSSGSYNDPSNTGSGDRHNPHTDSGTSKTDLSIGPDRSTVGIAAPEPHSPSEIEKGYTDDGLKLSNVNGKMMTKSEMFNKGIVETDPNTGEEVMGRNTINSNTGELERTNLTFSEHWANAPDALKFSPSMRFLYASGKNIGEWSTKRGFKGFNEAGERGKLGNATDYYNDRSNNNSLETAVGGGDNERYRMNTIAPQAPYIVSGIAPPNSSPAADWYANLGKTSTNNSSNIGLQYANAKQAVAKTLSNKGAIGMLAVNDSPYYDWLKTKGLDKGIL